MPDRAAGCLTSHNGRRRGSTASQSIVLCFAGSSCLQVALRQQERQPRPPGDGGAKQKLGVRSRCSDLKNRGRAFLEELLIIMRSQGGLGIGFPENAFLVAGRIAQNLFLGRDEFRPGRPR